MLNSIQIVIIASLPIMKIIYIVLIWAIMHHMCAGIRFVLLDTHKGMNVQMRNVPRVGLLS